MQLTPHFTLAEFGDVPKGKVEAARAVAEALEVIRARIQRPIIITSGYRSPSHNRQVGGAPNSAHIRALAADYIVEGINGHVLAQASLQALRDTGQPFDQIIWYRSNDHVHLGLDQRMRGQFFGLA